MDKERKGERDGCMDGSMERWLDGWIDGWIKSACMRGKKNISLLPRLMITDRRQNERHLRATPFNNASKGHNLLPLHRARPPTNHAAGSVVNLEILARGREGPFTALRSRAYRDFGE